MIKQIVKKKRTINKNIEATSNRKLSIQFSLDGFSFCISNTQNEVFEFSSFNFSKTVNSPELVLEKLQEIFKTEKSLQEDFESVTVIHQNNLSTLVPNKYFKEDALKNYLKYSVKTIATEFEYKHHSSILLEKLFLQSNASLHFYVNISHSIFDIVVIEDAKLLFYNIFEYQTKEDFIYYVLFTLEQLELNPEETIISLLGDIDKESSLFKVLYTYVRNICFLNSKNTIFNDQTEIAKHSNFILLG